MFCQHYKPVYRCPPKFGAVQPDQTLSKLECRTKRFLKCKIELGFRRKHVKFHCFLLTTSSIFPCKSLAFRNKEMSLKDLHKIAISIICTAFDKITFVRLQNVFLETKSRRKSRGKRISVILSVKSFVIELFGCKTKYDSNWARLHASVITKRTAKELPRTLPKTAKIKITLVVRTRA